MLKSMSISEDHLISLITSSTAKPHLRQIHAVLLRTSLIKSSDIFHHFLSRLALSLVPRDINYSRRVFSHRTNPTLSHCNTMIRAFSLSETPSQGFLLFSSLRRKTFPPANPLSSSFALKCCIKSRDLTGGLQIHGKIFRDGFLSDSLLLTTLMDFYSTFENSNDACKVFDEIPERDTVSYNVLMSCFLRNKRTRDVLYHFDNMIKNGSVNKPDGVTCLRALQACSSLGALDFGKQVHAFIDENGLGGALNLSNTLVSMYSRCGDMDKAYEVFGEMRERNVVSWTAMISGLAMNGFGREAIEAFEEMLKCGVSPEEQTLTGLLSACSHSGLVDEGMMFFERLKSGEFNKMKPNLHHYGCVVDLLGRARLLEKAYSLVESMEMKPDSTIWRTLLGACRVQGNVELGERVISRLIELKAEEAGDYVLLLNTYSSAGRWEKVTELRSLMKEKRIHTKPGCSAIEVEQGKVHEFIVDDVSHPRKEEIYKMLEEINQQLKIAGYVAETASELHNIESEEEKGRALTYHSEKLAIAFGILVTPPGTTIRVTKNLRTCVDCHNFAKFVSRVYDRVVIVRDRSRFHHFKDGFCSCNEFW
ncbi:unnamed protein product [Eruca vesicaria subsp. sativa]|uniref:DYW domain-containing protein n=1 Tax=Eruca vesicaria subsp. sativa TaxID=29727 RepID=A0ABC8KNH1_ERUVS|nr:unnamed protein product [Eruca vesicaria subsp. sativa]